MISKKELFNKNGFSLVEVMISMAVMGLLISAFSHFLLSQSQAVSHLEDRLSKNELKGYITSIFMDPVACKRTFENHNIITGPKNFGRIFNTVGTKVFHLTSTTGKDKHNALKIKEMLLSNVDISTIGNGQSGFAEFKVSVDRIRTGGGRIAPITIKLLVKNGAGGKTIETCRAYGENVSVSTIGLFICSSKLMFYHPTSSSADSDGCVGIVTARVTRPRVTPKPTVVTPPGEASGNNPDGTPR